MSIDILLSTYNSQDYLNDLWDSLLGQSNQDWQLLVRDDCSTDETMKVLNELKENYGNKISIIENDGQRLGAKLSFESLLQRSNADYIMFCDHDDYWLSHKIKDSLHTIQQLEKSKPNQPALVFSDLTVVDKSLNVIHPSFWNYSKINPKNIFNTYKLLINNPAPGCTLLFNKALKALVLPFPEEIRMHDWWIALKASESGVTSYCEKATILYRLHDNNEIGVDAVNRMYFKSKFKNIKHTWHENLRTLKMMNCLSNNYSLLKLIYYKVIISFSKLF